MQSDRHDGCSAASNLSHSLPSAGGLSKGGIGSESWLKPPAFPDVSLGVPTRPVIDKAAKQDGCKNIGRDTRDYAGVSESFPRTRLSSRDSQRQAGSSLPPTETGGWELSLSGKTLFGPATCFAPLIVNLDSGFDDETHMALLHGLEHTSQEEEEEEQRIRYFRTMDLSLERRFSDVVQLEPDEDPDSDDDDCQERLITPGTLAEPDAWLLKTPRAEHPMVETKNGSSRHSKQFSGFVSSPSERPLNLSPSVEIDQARSSTVPERCVPSGMFRILSASSPMQPQSLEREVAQTAGVEQSALRQEIQTSSDYLLQEGLPMSRLSIISPLSILSKPMSRQGTFAPKAINTSLNSPCDHHSTSQVTNSISDKIIKAPLLSPIGLGILCNPLETVQNKTVRPVTLTRSVTEPARLLGKVCPPTILDHQKSQRSRHHCNSTDHSGLEEPARGPASQSGAQGAIDMTGCTSTTSPPPLPLSARQVSAILPPRVFANQSSSSLLDSRRKQINNLSHRNTQSKRSIFQTELETSGIEHKPTKSYAYPACNSFSSPRLHSTRRSALHPGHPYALEADSFAPAFSQNTIDSAAILDPCDSATLGNRTVSSKTNSCGFRHHTAAVSEMLLPVSTTRPTHIHSRPRLHPRHHTDTVLVSPSYRQASCTPPSAPKLPSHGIFDNPLPFKESDC